MRMFLVGWMIMVAAGQSWAQQACPAYDRLIGEARTCVKNHRYDSALLKFNSARQRGRNSEDDPGYDAVQ